jgi:hypothetical protein
MNILPLVLLLILILSAFTMRQIESFKNSEGVKKEYMDFIRYQEGKDLSFRQKKFYNHEGYSKNRRLNFRPFFDKNVRKLLTEEDFTQLSSIFKELVRVLYTDATFFKKMQDKRPQFMDEIIQYIVDKSESDAKAFDGRIENLAQVKFNHDPELQEVFYQMLKGTIDTQEEIAIEEYKSIDTNYRAKSYKSLLDYLRDCAMPNCQGTPAKVIVYLSPPELLFAIYEKEAALQIMKKIEDLDNSELTNDIKKQEFESMAKDLAKNAGISNKILDFSVSSKQIDDGN